MNNREKLERIVQQLNDEQISSLLDFAIFLKIKEKANTSILESQAYTDWLSSENDIYDELFNNELSTR